MRLPFLVLISGFIFLWVLFGCDSGANNRSLLGSDIEPVQPVIKDDHGSICDTATGIALHSSTPGKLEVGNDVDVFRLTLPMDGRLTVSAIGDADTTGTLRDTVGTEIAFDDDMGFELNFSLSQNLAAGTYCIEVRGFENATGDYTFVANFEAFVSEDIEDDFGNTCATATVVELDSSILGGLEVDGDVDVFRLTLPTNGLLTVTTAGDTNTFGTLRAVGFDETGLASDDDSGFSANFLLSYGLAAGAYCIEVRGGGRTAIGSYIFEASFEAIEDDHGNTCATATLVSPNDATPGNLAINNEVDVFRMALTTDGILTVAIPGSIETNVTVLILSEGGSTEENNISDLVMIPSVPSTVFLRAGNYCFSVSPAISSLETGSYRFETHFEAGEIGDDHGESCVTAKVVSPNKVITGELDEVVLNDIDVFRMTLLTDGTLSLTAFNRFIFGSVRDLAGRVFAESFIGLGLVDTSMFVLLPAGTYCIEVGKETGPYELVTSFREQNIKADDHGGACDTATVVSPDTVTAGALEKSGDIDVLRLTLPTDGRLTVTMLGTTDTVEILRDETGTELASSDDPYLDDSFLVEDLAAGTYCIEVTGEEGAFGLYHLVVSFEDAGSGELEEDDHGGTCALATVVSPDTVIAGVLEESNDIDVFRLTLPADGRLIVTTLGTTDTAGTLRDEAGRELASNDYGGFGLNFLLSQDLAAGTYCVEVRALLSTMGSYRLVLSFEEVGEGEIQEDDHGGTCSTATVVSPDSAASGHLEDVDDVDSFRLTLPETGVLTVTTTGDTNTVGSLLGADGAELAFDEGGGDFNLSNPNFLISRILPAGSYCIEVTGKRDAEGDYTFLASLAPFGDDHGDTCDAATDVSPNATIPGNIAAVNEVDVFRMIVPKDGVLRVESLGLLSSDEDILVQILSEEGAGREGRARDNILSLSPPFSLFLPTGAHCFTVSSTYPGFGPDRYRFETRFEERAIGDDHSEVCATATVVSPNDLTAGLLDEVIHNDVDVFRVTLPEDGVLTVSTFDALIVGRIRDLAGNVLAEDVLGDPEADIVLSPRLDAGTYCVEVGQGAGRYTLVTSFEAVAADDG